MNREDVEKLIHEDEPDSSRSELTKYFCGLHPCTVVEALVMWAELNDCPPKIGAVLKPLREQISYLPEFNIVDDEG